MLAVASMVVLSICLRRRDSRSPSPSAPPTPRPAWRAVGRARPGGRAPFARLPIGGGRRRWHDRPPVGAGRRDGRRCRGQP
ncbi:hypothetical protein [Streptomyces viridochromogenes]|uniref:hypothetical protein n=1 Tax=Streptomyces viridochromogenes TaxID=1938 RepID=UPI002E13D354